LRNHWYEAGVISLRAADLGSLVLGSAVILVGWLTAPSAFSPALLVLGGVLVFVSSTVRLVRYVHERDKRIKDGAAK